MITKRCLIAATLVVCLPAALPASTIVFGEGEDVSLAELEAGAEIIVGDKLFTNFGFTPGASTLLTADDVIVSGSFNDGTGQATLTFDQGLDFAASGGSFGPETQNYTLTFSVHILDPNYVFDAVSLISTSDVPSLERGGVENTGLASISETVIGRETADGPTVGFGPLLTINQVDGGLQGALSTVDSIDLPDEFGFKYLDVVKDVGVTVGVDPDLFDFAAITSFQQVFGQRPVELIPEPTTAALLLIAVVGARGRRRHAI